MGWFGTYLRLAGREPAVEELGLDSRKKILSLISLTKDALDSTLLVSFFFEFLIDKRKGNSTFNIKVSSQTGIAVDSQRLILTAVSVRFWDKAWGMTDSIHSIIVDHPSQ